MCSTNITSNTANTAANIEILVTSSPFLFLFFSPLLISPFLTEAVVD